MRCDRRVCAGCTAELNLAMFVLERRECFADLDEALQLVLLLDLAILLL